MLTKSAAFIILSLGFMAGIFLASAVKISTSWIFGGLAAGVVGLALLAVEARGQSKTLIRRPLARSTRRMTRRTKFLQAFFLLLGLFAGVWRLNASQAPNLLKDLVGPKQDFEGVIVTDVDIRTDHLLITVQPDHFDQLILITLPLGRHYFYGDRVWVVGKVDLPKSSDDFDYARYLEQKNVYATMYHPRVIVLKAHHANQVSEILLRIKARFMRRTSRILPSVEANLLLGILIGARKALPQDVINNFSITGVSHVIAISGYNISIIVVVLEQFAVYFGRRLSFILSLAVIIGFVIISGASSSVIRAAIMGSLMLLSFNIGRLYAVVPALSCAAVVMLIINPKILYWDVGFQLSFLATVGIIGFVPLMDALTARWLNPLQLKSIIITTLAASLVTAPLIALQFGTLSVIGPIVNLLVLPFVPMTMLFGFLIFLPGIGLGFGWLAHWLLWYMLAVTNFFAHLPHASLSVKFSGLACGVAYLAIVILFLILRRWARRFSPGQS